MARPSSYPRELRERAIRMVSETKGEYRSEFAAIESVADKLGIGRSLQQPIQHACARTHAEHQQGVL
jgi:transposase-like protein